MPTALIITAPGTNCDLELGEAFRLAGAETESILLKRLIAEPALIHGFDLIGLPGGFSYGDDIAAGRIVAVLMRRHLYGALKEAVGRGVPMMCPCNGLQIAVQAGLLPGAASESTEPPTPTVALCDNSSATFSDRWVRVEIPAQTRCVWTQGLSTDAPGLGGDAMMLPIAHGEGRFMADASTIAQLEAAGQIAIRYAADDNPNGSMNNIAGICDATGLVFGLMPHPERYTRWTQHPWWTRLGSDATSGETLGLRMFRNAVAACAQVAV
jgi:phosphoribosylformylglycinamidine synthase subunit PurQ / glutaminase